MADPSKRRSMCIDRSSNIRISCVTNPWRHRRSATWWSCDLVSRNGGHPYKELFPMKGCRLSPTEQQCARETFSIEYTFHLARRVYGESSKTVRMSGTAIIMFPSEIRTGVWRRSSTLATAWVTTVRHNTQGFISSKNRYNRPFYEIIANFQRRKQWIDDTIHWDVELQNHWWWTIILPHLRRQSRDSPQPGRIPVCTTHRRLRMILHIHHYDWATPEISGPIRDFPTPTSTTDTRSWFGLVKIGLRWPRRRHWSQSSGQDPWQPYIRRNEELLDISLQTANTACPGISKWRISAAYATSRHSSQIGYAELTSLTINCFGLDYVECVLLSQLFVVVLHYWYAGSTSPWTRTSSDSGIWLLIISQLSKPEVTFDRSKSESFSSTRCGGSLCRQMRMLRTLCALDSRAWRPYMPTREPCRRCIGVRVYICPKPARASLEHMW